MDLGIAIVSPFLINTFSHTLILSDEGNQEKFAEKFGVVNVCKMSFWHTFQILQLTMVYQNSQYVFNIDKLSLR